MLGWDVDKIRLVDRLRFRAEARKRKSDSVATRNAVNADGNQYQQYLNHLKKETRA